MRKQWWQNVWIWKAERCSYLSTMMSANGGLMDKTLGQALGNQGFEIRVEVYTDNFFRNLMKSNRNHIVFTIFRLIWNQTDACLVLNQSEIGKYNLISVWFNKISKRFLCVWQYNFQVIFNCKTFFKTFKCKTFSDNYKLPLNSNH